ncbi:MAG: hypothetical protein DWQ19_11205 [Crenarchaeota archaeon]|nr:MAG: hypothetical protein DWQ19_11205 [Thermoproteota archaeon]
MIDLEAILKYEMTEIEAKAYKLCLLWQEIMDQELPDYHKNRLPKGDPRKSLIFKYCYKLARETQGLIPDSQYRLYILAQIQSLRLISDGTVHALIEPGCLVGDKAWRRWKIWKRKFDRKYEVLNPSVDIQTTQESAINELKRTRNFYIANFSEDYGKKEVEKIIRNKDIIKWVAFSKVSPFYLALSPLIKNHFNDIENSFSVDIEFYQKQITSEIQDIFVEMFPWDQ